MDETTGGGGPITLGEKFLSGMSVEPLFVSLDMRRTEALAEAAAR